MQHNHKIIRIGILIRGSLLGHMVLIFDLHSEFLGVLQHQNFESLLQLSGHRFSLN